MRSVLTCILFATLAACGGSASSETRDAAAEVEDVGAADVARDTAAPSDTSVVTGPISVCTHCPASLPVDGAPCPYAEASYLVCSYGTNPVPWCRPRALCGFDGWRVSKGAECLAKNCPSAPAPGAACDEFSRSCFYDDGTLCTCARGVTECRSPLPGCSALLPNAGDRCSGDVGNCGYAAVTVGPDNVVGVGAECAEGCWQLVFFSGK